MTHAIANNLLTTEAGVGRWDLDAQASTVRIAHKILWGLIPVKGGFTGLAGEVTVAAGGSVTGTVWIDVTSIDTKNKRRDVHLRSSDFLDVETHPDITIAIASAAVVGENVQLQARVSIKGHSEPLQLIARITDVTDDAVAAAVEVQIDRRRFGLSWNPLGMLSGPTTVTVNAVFNHMS
jgi:polyisoprenoid-binding protein YceI